MKQIFIEERVSGSLHQLHRRGGGALEGSALRAGDGVTCRCLGGTLWKWL